MALFRVLRQDFRAKITFTFSRKAELGWLVLLCLGMGMFLISYGIHDYIEKLDPDWLSKRQSYYVTQKLLYDMFGPVGSLVLPGGLALFLLLVLIMFWWEHKWICRSIPELNESAK